MTSDSIDRQAVLKAINNMVKECDSDYVTSALRNLEVIVAELPSAQPIIRCKECKHGMYDMMCKFYWCHGVAHSANWFCADAERKTNGN